MKKTHYFPLIQNSSYFPLIQNSNLSPVKIIPDKNCPSSLLRSKEEIFDLTDDYINWFWGVETKSVKQTGKTYFKPCLRVAVKEDDFDGDFDFMFRKIDITSEDEYQQKLAQEEKAEQEAQQQAFLKKVLQEKGEKVRAIVNVVIQNEGRFR